MTKQANSLDARLAKALTSDTDRDVLFALWHEAFATIKAAEQTVEAESARALDIENPDPDEADATARKARLTIGRLTKAIPRLRERIEAIDKRNYAIEWHKHAAVCTKNLDSDVLVVQPIIRAGFIQ